MFLIIGFVDCGMSGNILILFLFLVCACFSHNLYTAGEARREIKFNKYEEARNRLSDQEKSLLDKQYEMILSDIKSKVKEGKYVTTFDWLYPCSVILQTSLKRLLIASGFSCNQCYPEFWTTITTGCVSCIKIGWG